MCFLNAANDFVSIVLEQRVFQTDTSTIPQCWTVVIINDNIVENTETFSVELSTSEPDIVLLSPSSAVVNIVDDDSKFNEYQTLLRSL